MNNFRSENISCKLISTLNELLNWNEVRKTRRNYAVSKLDLTNSREVEEAPKVIVCHDMANNYHEDRLFQGSANIDSCYNFYHWQLIDLFIYFSHHMVTIPCESWINAAHCNGVRILGCFITEFNQGEAIWDELVSSKDLLDRVIDVLVDITVFFGFDGWLLNIENAVERVDRLKYFVDRLTRQLKKIDPDLYRVIWYDSVTVDGDLKWQNELNRMNDVFFQLSDGWFVYSRFK
jgi:mannosyl-glycoprotein endo-beta-N-acetylglucosaminidase